MSEIKSWVFSVCVAMVCCGIARALLPGGATQRVFGVTVSAFLLCAMLSPLLLQSPELRLELQYNGAEEIAERARRLEQTVESQSERAATAGIEKIVDEKLMEMGINYRHITIHMNHNGQSGWNGGRADIELDSEYRASAERIRRQLENSLGLDVAIAFIGEEVNEDEAEI